MNSMGEWQQGQGSSVDRVRAMSRGRQLRLLIGCVVLVVGGLWLMAQPGIWAGDRVRLGFVNFRLNATAVRILGLIGVAFFGYGAAVIAVALRRLR
jgi:hypothetical protein